MADKASGYILLHRSLIDHWLWQGEPFTKGQAWIDLLLLVNYKPGKTRFNGQVCEVDRGGRVTSYQVLAERWQWSKSSVKRFLKMLEDDQMIEIKTTHRQTIVKVLNYDVYQVLQSENDTPKKQQRNTDDTLAAQRRNADDTLAAQEYKESNTSNEGNTGNEINIPPISPQGDTGEDWHGRFRPEMGAKLDEWLAYKAERREKYKPQGLKTLINKAEKEVATYGEAAVMDVIDSSMSSGYQGIVWDRLAGSHAGSKTAGYAGTKTSGGSTKPKDDNLDDLLTQMTKWGWD